jgi:hypothetical protein
MTFKQQKQLLAEYLKQDVASYKGMYDELDIPENSLPVICNNGCIVDVYTFDQIDQMIEQANTLQDLEIMCQKTLNFAWSVSFCEVCEFAGIDVGNYEFLGL